ncbi:bifunctional N(6)-L-threonylcarbamoyladenine synthase/serine/threonine protein kinase [Halomarina oriensis]|uniref:Probable bifunctional tRNA threonylcarbamoyladenosine biosynthesis protein n=1 Tax=Halomarina oriensis TaxID=671145 RepID=A0A6B0GRG5_9EURY|nr:bifunctional N(6)-L-threonylcarbamoyladenine synthase/serine/threonine protein kinase [Halomarina oriensis]
MRVLGIEGTAWAASAAVHDTEAGDTRIFTDAYLPESGGIHPREAAEHMRGAIPTQVATALDYARETTPENRPSDDPPVDAVAFSRGPGLGPCLRIVATAARTVAQRLDVPLVGVNHMLAHLEIGRASAGFDSPVCLNASGANAHLLGYHGGRYRMLGETMDTGVGNAIDKFTRHLDWSHPGGPKVEAAAEDGAYVDLPYVVTGMEFSFSGIMSAAKQAVDDGVPVEDVCFSLQEHVFGMLTEVAERALSLTGSDELVLGGGVGQNARLREMLAEMCDQRGASFHAPEPRFLRDNAGMIAVLGARMAAAGDTVAVEESAVRPNWRPNDVPVTWRDGEDVSRAATPREGPTQRGAEATVSLGERVVKRREAKSYRHPDLDARLRRERTRAEARLLHDARKLGVSTPVVHDVDQREATITMERVGASDLAGRLDPDLVATVGRHLATLHGAGVVHGDPTTRNVRVPDATGRALGGGSERTWLVDFGLGYHSDDVEDYAMDCHVFEGSVVGTADDPAPLVDAFEAAYRETGDPSVVEQLRDIEGRGRYQ